MHTVYIFILKTNCLEKPLNFNCWMNDQLIQHSRKDHSRFIVMSVFAKLFDSWCMVLSGGDVLDISSLFYQHSDAIETKIKKRFVYYSKVMSEREWCQL